MSGNTFGKLFSVTTFGESHGPAIGCVIDGCPPGLPLSEADIQPELDRRKPGTSRHVTQRQESDTVEILSGVYQGVTTGFERYRLPYDALTQTSLAAVDLSTRFLGSPLAAPVLIGAMTGGAELARTINRNLADAAQKLGVGSTVQLVPEMADPKDLFACATAARPVLRKAA